MNNKQKLIEVSKVYSGQGAPQGDKWFNGKNIFVRSGDLNKLSDGMFVGDYCEKINNEAIKEYSLKLFPKNCVVFPKSGMSIATENIALLKYDSYVVNHLAVIECKDIIDAKYIFYSLKKLKISRLIRNESYPSIRLSDIQNLTFVFPEKKIRTYTVSTLEKMEKIKQMRKKGYELVEQFLNNTFIEIFGSFENLKNSQVLTLEQMLEEGHIVSHLDGNHGSNYPRNEEFVSSGVPYIGANCINNEKINYDKAKFLTFARAKKFKKGVTKNEDVLFAHNASVGSTVVLETKNDFEILSTSLTYYRCNKKMINPYYLASFMKSSYFVNQYKEIMKQTTRNQVPITTQRKFKHIIPPIELQNEFASIVKEIMKIKKYQEESNIHIVKLYNETMEKLL